MTPSSLTPGLYIVATPIGNLGDITYRAVATLRSADLIACEDTRISSRLLSHYDIKTPLTPYHDHNGEAVRPGLLDKIEAGASLALISDAGTPLISDPGYKLVAQARARGLAVTAVPGPSAVINALSIAGLPTARFAFIGFPPNKSAARQRFFQSIKSFDGTIAYYESAQRLAESLADLATVLGDREVVVARELTKRFEQVRLGTVLELAEDYEKQGPPKGEVVVLVGPPEATLESSEDLMAMLRAARARLSLKDAVAEVTQVTGRRRKEVYQLALDLEKEQP